MRKMPGYGPMTVTGLVVAVVGVAFLVLAYAFAPLVVGYGFQLAVLGLCIAGASASTHWIVRRIQSCRWGRLQE